MKVFDRLLESAKEIWDAYNTHPFVYGIENGTLEKEKFRYYIIQDYIYLIDFAKVFAIGVAKSKSLDTASLFSIHIEFLNNGEMDIHKGYMGEFKVTKEELESTKMSLDNLSYTSYMLRVAYEEGEAEILAAVLSCAYSYEVIAKTIVKNNPKSIDNSLFGDWIKGYASKKYADRNVDLINTFNKLTANYTEEQINHLIDIFVACSRYELAFWEMSWNMNN